jgi:hypothetical protein
MTKAKYNKKCLAFIFFPLISALPARRLHPSSVPNQIKLKKKDFMPKSGNMAYFCGVARSGVGEVGQCPVFF